MAKILIVDDRPANREFLVTLLGYKGHALLEAADGAEALQTVRADRPDLVICDILMPTMDGFAFVQQLRSEPPIAGTPVVFCTAHYLERETAELARSCGVSHVITKPAEPQLVLDIVANVLQRPAVHAHPATPVFEHEHLRLVTDKLSRTAEDLRNANERMAALVELNLRLASELDPQRLLEQVCLGARQLLGARYGALGVRDRETARTMRFVTSGISAQLAKAFGLPPLDRGILGTVMTGGRPCRVARNAIASTAVGLPEGFASAQSLLAAPVASPTGTYGWICLTDKLAGGEFTEDDERMLAILAAQTGRIYENGSLYRKVQLHAAEMEIEIAERRRAEEGLLRFRTAMETSLDGIFIMDFETFRYLDINETGCQMLGYTREELLGMRTMDTNLEITETSQRARFEQAKALGSGKVMTELEGRYMRRKDGATFPIEAARRYLRIGGKEIVVGIARDITERRRAEQALLAERTLLRTLIDALPDAVFTKDTAGRFIMCNVATFAHSGLSSEEAILGKSVFDLYPEEMAQSYHADDLRTLAGEPVLNREEVSVDAAGAQRWFLTNKVPLRDHAGATIGMVGISRDITERKQAEQQILESEAKYRALIEQASDGIFVSDAAGNFVMVNTRGCQLLGYAPGELIGLNGKVTYLEGETAIHTQRMAAVVAGDDLRYERMVKRKDGGAFPAEISLKMLDNGMVQVIFHDITTRRSQERKIARLSRIQAVLSGINSAIVRIHERQALFDEACQIATEQGAFPVALIGIAGPAQRLQPVAWGGSAADILSALPPSVRGAPTGVAMRAINEQSVVIDNDICADPDIDPIRKEAIARGCRSAIGLPLFKEKEIIGVFLLYGSEIGFFDEEEVKLLKELAGDVSFALTFIAQQEKVDYLAYYDALTGLPNRSLFFDRLGQQLGAARRDHGGMALVLIDLDRFRLVNDTLGRQAGDALLETVAKRIKDSIRSQDSVARIGANRFAFAVSGISSSAEAAHALEARNNALFGEPFILGHEELRVLATAGVAMFPGDGNDAESLFANAEAALRKAKAENLRFLFYSPEINARVADSLRLENKLRRALDNGELVLWYQPKVDSRTRRLTGFEALMRWKDPETGMVPPAKFIPLMEQTGLILDAGRWALLQVGRDSRTWTAEGIKPPRVAVNVSPIQLRQKDFVATVVEAAEQAEEAGALLELEITESVIMENVETIIPMLQTVRGLGVDIAIDDFGTGYSSLAYIARLPIQALKIDRSFVVGMTQGEDSLAIVRSVISLAHALRLHVIAEGVETEEQATLLRDLECDEMQGYLFSKPVPPEEVPALVRRLTQD